MTSMRLPESDKVIIPKEKLLDYVFSETHATGKFKAKFFRKLGFDETHVELFDKALRIIAKSNEITGEVKSEYGTKYLVDGAIKTPNEKVVKVRTVWIIEKGQRNPRFVTVYPV